MKTLLLSLLTAASVVFVWAQTTSTNKPSASVTSPNSLKRLSETPTNLAPRMDRSGDFDFDVGFDAAWAAEKKLIILFSGEGFIMQGQPYKNGLETSVFERASDGAKVNYAYARPVSGKLAEYRLAATRKTPGLTALLSIAGKISADRFSVVNEALKEFNVTQKPVVKEGRGFKQRGDFRVRVDENTVALDNLWKAKGI